MPGPTAQDGPDGPKTAATRAPTGVYFHELFKDPMWPVISNKFQGFPEVFGPLLASERVELITPTPVPLSALEGVHTPRVIRALDAAWYRDGALTSIGGAIEACERVWRGDLQNALVFGVAAGHHAERDSVWGGTYASVSGPVIRALQTRHGVERVAIIDTDSHHGNGTRDVTFGNRGVLHLCFCDANVVEDGGTKICRAVGYDTTDTEYLAVVREAFETHLEPFQPQLLLHLLGHDTARGDYGDRGLTVACFADLVRYFHARAGALCEGRLVVGSHGGARRDVCERVFVDALRILAGL